MCSGVRLLDRKHQSGEQRSAHCSDLRAARATRWRDKQSHLYQLLRCPSGQLRLERTYLCRVTGLVVAACQMLAFLLPLFWTNMSMAYLYTPKRGERRSFSGRCVLVKMLRPRRENGSILSTLARRWCVDDLKWRSPASCVGMCRDACRTTVHGEVDSSKRMEGGSPEKASGGGSTMKVSSLCAKHFQSGAQKAIIGHIDENP